MPSCLKVERAITFFISNSNRAAMPAIVVVKRPKIKIVCLQRATKQLNRIRRYTPAVTRVEECTKADTGVGAAIAAGNHDERGICALLVILAKMIKAKIGHSPNRRLAQLYTLKA